MDAEIWAAIIAGILSIFAAAVTYWVQKSKERESTEKEARLAFRRDQVEKLYGPLHNLLTHLIIYDSVLEGIRRDGQQILTHDQKAQIGRFFYSNYFHPLHEETAAIIKLNMHLIRNKDTADLILDYLQHSLQEVTQNRLDSEMGISTIYLAGRPFPNKLAESVKKDLDEIYKEIAQLE